MYAFLFLMTVNILKMQFLGVCVSVLTSVHLNICREFIH